MGRVGSNAALPTLVRLTERGSGGSGQGGHYFQTHRWDANPGPLGLVLSLHFAIRPRPPSTGQREDGEVGGCQLGFSTPRPAPAMPQGPSPALLLCAMGLVWLLTLFLVLIFSYLVDTYIHLCQSPF